MSASSSSNSVIADAKLSSPLPLSKSTILITGGSTGLGFALAKRFVGVGSTVIITGRRLDQLENAKKQIPSLIIKQSDAGLESDRDELYEWTVKNYPNVNILINNAGVSRPFGLAVDNAPWKEKAKEIEINLFGPIHLSHKFTPHFLSLKSIDSAIINVTSGLAFLPFVAAPTYAATKAALHSFTVSQRWSLQGTRVGVIEIVPPAVKTNIGGREPYGEDLDEWADSTFAQLVSGSVEIGYKMSDTVRKASRQQLDETFTGVSPTLHVKQYSQL